MVPVKVLWQGRIIVVGSYVKLCPHNAVCIRVARLLLLSSFLAILWFWSLPSNFTNLETDDALLKAISILLQVNRDLIFVDG